MDSFKPQFQVFLETLIFAKMAGMIVVQKTRFNVLLYLFLAN